jgi:hypothetical protein
LKDVLRFLLKQKGRGSEILGFLLMFSKDTSESTERIFIKNMKTSGPNQDQLKSITFGTIGLLRNPN